MTTTNWRAQIEKAVYGDFVPLDGSLVMNNEEKEDMYQRIEKLLSSTHKEWAKDVIEKLKPYLEHYKNCDVLWEIDDEKCHCGLDAAIEAIKSTNQVKG